LRENLPIRVFHPETAEHFKRRNLLLQTALREISLPFTIESEYPIVLGTSGRTFSYCVAAGKADDIVAHANLWPRVLDDAKAEFPFGLVGNVATSAAFRGQGLMHSLFANLKEESQRLGLNGLILWSDLAQFYQKQGFTSFGRERRYQLAGEALRSLVQSANFSAAYLVERRAAGTFLPGELRKLLSLRPSVTTALRRDPSEFAQQLTIPALSVFTAVRRSDREVAAYAVFGKGYDMVGVVHEWGAESPEALLATLSAVAKSCTFAEIIVLAPGSLASPWHEIFATRSTGITDHPVGLAWVNADAAGCATATKALETCFIWGPDSI